MEVETKVSVENSSTVFGSNGSGRKSSGGVENESLTKVNKLEMFSTANANVRDGGGSNGGSGGVRDSRSIVEAHLLNSTPNNRHYHTADGRDSTGNGHRHLEQTANNFQRYEHGETVDSSAWPPRSQYPLHFQPTVSRQHEYPTAAAAFPVQMGLQWPYGGVQFPTYTSGQDAQLISGHIATSQSGIPTSAQAVAAAAAANHTTGSWGYFESPAQRTAPEDGENNVGKKDPSPFGRNDNSVMCVAGDGAIQTGEKPASSNGFNGNGLMPREQVKAERGFAGGRALHTCEKPVSNNGFSVILPMPRKHVESTKSDLQTTKSDFRKSSFSIESLLAKDDKHRSVASTSARIHTGENSRDEQHPVPAFDVTAPSTATASVRKPLKRRPPPPLIPLFIGTTYRLPTALKRRPKHDMTLKRVDHEPSPEYEFMPLITEVRSLSPSSASSSESGGHVEEETEVTAGDRGVLSSTGGTENAQKVAPTTTTSEQHEVKPSTTTSGDNELAQKVAHTIVTAEERQGLPSATSDDNADKSTDAAQQHQVLSSITTSSDSEYAQKTASTTMKRCPSLALLSADERDVLLSTTAFGDNETGKVQKAASIATKRCPMIKRGVLSGSDVKHTVSKKRHTTFVKKGSCVSGAKATVARQHENGEIAFEINEKSIRVSDQMMAEGVDKAKGGDWATNSEKNEMQNDNGGEKKLGGGTYVAENYVKKMNGIRDHFAENDLEKMNGIQNHFAEKDLEEINGRESHDDTMTDLTGEVHCKIELPDEDEQTEENVMENEYSIEDTKSGNESDKEISVAGETLAEDVNFTNDITKAIVSSDDSPESGYGSSPPATSSVDSIADQSAKLSAAKCLMSLLNSNASNANTGHLSTSNANTAHFSTSSANTAHFSNSNTANANQDNFFPNTQIHSIHSNTLPIFEAPDFSNNNDDFGLETINVDDLVKDILAMDDGQSNNLNRDVGGAFADQPESYGDMNLTGDYSENFITTLGDQGEQQHQPVWQSSSIDQQLPLTPETFNYEAVSALKDELSSLFANSIENNHCTSDDDVKQMRDGLNDAYDYWVNGELEQTFDILNHVLQCQISGGVQNLRLTEETIGLMDAMLGEDQMELDAQCGVGERGEYLEIGAMVSGGNDREVRGNKVSSEVRDGIWANEPGQTTYDFQQMTGGYEDTEMTMPELAPVSAMQSLNTSVMSDEFPIPNLTPQKKVPFGSEPAKKKRKKARRERAIVDENQNEVHVKQEVKIPVMIRNASVTPYQCSICPASFSTTGRLKSHLKRIHLSGSIGDFQVGFSDLPQVQNGDSQQVPPVSYQCTMCQASLTSKRSLQRHTEWVHFKNFPFRCDMACGSVTQAIDGGAAITSVKSEPATTSAVLNGDASATTSVKSESATAATTVTSPTMCSFTCRERRDLLAHKFEHTGRLHFNCELCNAEYRTYAALLSHSHEIHSCRPKSKFRKSKVKTEGAGQHELPMLSPYFSPKRKQTPAEKLGGFKFMKSESDGFKFMKGEPMEPLGNGTTDAENINGNDELLHSTNFDGHFESFDATRNSTDENLPDFQQVSETRIEQNTASVAHPDAALSSDVAAFTVSSEGVQIDWENHTAEKPTETNGAPRRKKKAKNKLFVDNNGEFVAQQFSVGVPSSCAGRNGAKGAKNSIQKKVKAEHAAEPYWGEMKHEERLPNIANEQSTTGRKSSTTVDSKKVVCKVCSKTFARSSGLNQHVKVFHENRRFKCGLCTFITPYKQKLRRHQQRDHNAEELSAHTAETFISHSTEEFPGGQKVHSDDSDMNEQGGKNNVAKHQHLDHMAEKPLGSLKTKAKNSDLGQSEAGNIEVGLKIETNNEATERRINDGKPVPAAITSSSKYLVCSLCPRTFASHSSFDEHQMSEHDSQKAPQECRPFHCEHCSFQTWHEHLLINHHQRQHSGEKQPDLRTSESGKESNINSRVNYVKGSNKLDETKDGNEIEEGRECHEMGEEIEAPSETGKTKIKLEKELTFTCNQCEVIFLDFGSLYEHMTTIHESNRYSCDTCAFSTFLKRELDKHRQSHMGRKPVDQQVEQQSSMGEKPVNEEMVRQSHVSEKPDMQTELPIHLVDEQMEQQSHSGTAVDIRMERRSYIKNPRDKPMKRQSHMDEVTVNEQIENESVMGERPDANHTEQQMHTDKKLLENLCTDGQMHVDERQLEKRGLETGDIENNEPKKRSVDHFQVLSDSESGIGDNLEISAPENGSMIANAAMVADGSDDDGIEKTESGKPIVSKRFACDLCTKTFARRDGLNIHRNTVHLNIRHQCALCPFETAYKQQIDNHRAAHTTENSLKCTLCSFSTSMKVSLTAHIRWHTHTGEKPTPTADD